MQVSHTATTREQAREAYDRLLDEDSGFRAALDNATGCDERIAVLARVVKNSDRLAELRPARGGRTVHLRRDQERWRAQAALARDAIRAEQARRTAAERGLDLPDPLGLRTTYMPEDALAKVLALVADAYEQFASWTPPHPERTR